MARKRKTSFRKIIGILLILAGIGVLLYVPSTWLWSYYLQRGLAEDFQQERVAAVAVNQDALANLAGAAESEKLMQLAEAFKASLKSQQTIAQIEIPRIGLNDIVVEGTDESSLRRGPGHLEETPLPGMRGNFSVAGDRVLYGAPFLNLDDVEMDDEIFLKTTYGDFSYLVTNKAIIDPDDVSLLQPVPGQELITLITCDPPWDTSHRLVIQGRLIDASVAPA
jgi:sortase A